MSSPHLTLPTSFNFTFTYPIQSTHHRFPSLSSPSATSANSIFVFPSPPATPSTQPPTTESHRKLSGFIFRDSNNGEDFWRARRSPLAVRRLGGRYSNVRSRTRIQPKGSAVEVTPEVATAKERLNGNLNANSGKTSEDVQTNGVRSDQRLDIPTSEKESPVSPVHPDESQAKPNQSRRIAVPHSQLAKFGRIMGQEQAQAAVLRRHVANMGPPIVVQAQASGREEKKTKVLYSPVTVKQQSPGTGRDIMMLLFRGKRKAEEELARQTKIPRADSGGD